MTKNYKNKPDFLIKKFLSSNDDRYFIELYNLFKDKVYGRCFSILHNELDTEDVFQLIWTKVYFALPSFRQESSFSTWIFRISSNEAINFLKKRKQSIQIEVDIVEDDEDLFESISDKIYVTKLLEIVSKEERALLVMKYMDGYKYKEIAQIASLSVSAVKMKISRAKQKIIKNENT